MLCAMRMLSKHCEHINGFYTYNTSGFVFRRFIYYVERRRFGDTKQENSFHILYLINDISIAQYVSPPLTTFHVNVPIICEAALELLRGRVFSRSSITRAIFINGTPTMRKSCK